MSCKLREFMQTDAPGKWYTYFLQHSVSFQTEADLIEAYRLLAPLAVLDRLNESRREVYRGFARFILEQVGRPVVVDYGCGSAPISMEVALMEPETRVYLLDVDSMALDFTAFCFARAGLRHEVIRATEETIYPLLPRHNVCIAAEVFEHLLDPMRAYRNILATLEGDGLLYGCFDDHKPGDLHVTPDLEAVRREVEKDFVGLSDEWAQGLFYRRRT